MSEATKQMFDQLTEDAMKLMENGEYSKCQFFQLKYYLSVCTSWQFFFPSWKIKYLDLLFKVHVM